MSIHDKTLQFANGLALPVTASTTTNSKIVDLRANGGLDEHLYIYAALKAAPSQTVTTKVVTSLDGTSWTEVDSSVNKGHVLFAKRYVKLAFAVGTTALSQAGEIFAEITDTIDRELDTSRVVEPRTDTAAQGDAVLSEE